MVSPVKTLIQDVLKKIKNVFTLNFNDLQHDNYYNIKI